MTTREELIQGFEMMKREGLRITSKFSPDDWKIVVHDDEGDGWNRKQVYSHVTAIAEISPSLAPNLAAVPEGGNAGEGVDLNAMNAQLVAAKNELSETELMATFETAHDNLIAFVKEMSQEQLDAQTAFMAVSGTVADVVDSLVILHGLSHIYSAGGSAVG
jgi:hypothetical protein